MIPALPELPLVVGVGDAIAAEVVHPPDEGASFATSLGEHLDEESAPERDVHGGGVGAEELPPEPQAEPRVELRLPLPEELKRTGGRADPEPGATALRIPDAERTEAAAARTRPEALVRATPSPRFEGPARAAAKTSPQRIEVAESGAAGRDRSEAAGRLSQESAGPGFTAPMAPVRVEPRSPEPVRAPLTAPESLLDRALPVREDRAVRTSPEGTAAPVGGDAARSAVAAFRPAATMLGGTRPPLRDGRAGNPGEGPAPDAEPLEVLGITRAEVTRAATSRADPVSPRISADQARPATENVAHESPPAEAALRPVLRGDSSAATPPLVAGGLEPPASAAPVAAAAHPEAGASRRAPLEEVPLRAQWLVERGGGSARIELDPPNLGRVDLAVRLRGADVEVIITAHEPLAQAAVQAQREQLAEGLAARDLQLTQFEVGDGRGEGRQGSGAGDSHGRAPGQGLRTLVPDAGAWRDPAARAATENAPARPGAPHARIDLHV